MTVDSLSRNLVATSKSEVELPTFILDLIEDNLDDLKATKRSEKTTQNINQKVGKLGDLFHKAIRKMGKAMGKDLENPESRNHASNTTEEPKYLRQVEEIHAWSKMAGMYNRRSPTAHLQELRKPKDFVHWYTNRSDAFDRFLFRSANPKIKATVQKWREIRCQNECCKDKACNDECCKGKEDGKMKNATEDDRVKHLQKELDALMVRVDSWRGGPNKRKLVEQVMNPIYEEMQWRDVHGKLTECWNEDSEAVQDLVNSRMEGYGLNLSDLKELEEALIEAEREEAARIEEEERLEREKTCAIDDQEEEDDDSNDDFDHLYFDIPSPPQTPIELMSVCNQELTTTRPIFLYQLDNGPLTPPGTPPNERTTPKPITEDEFLLNLTAGLIEDLTKEREVWTRKKGYTFNPDVLNRPIYDGPYEGCAWKLHPVSDFIKDLPPPPTQTYPDVRLTDPEGNVFTLEERLPKLRQDFKYELVEREAWSVAIEELNRRGCNFEQIPQWNAVNLLRESGWKPKEEETDSDDSDDEEDERTRQQISSQEARQELNIMDLVSGPATFSNDELKVIFDQKITFVEPGQEINISTPEPTNSDMKEDPEMGLINALRIDIHERQQLYQQKWAENLYAASRCACPPTGRLPQSSHCSWKQHPLTIPLSPSILPSIVVTDPEGNIYTLEECASTLDENSYYNITMRNAWQSQKEILLGEEGECDEEYAKRLRHLADWEMEFRRVDDGWLKRERGERVMEREEEIMVLKEGVEGREAMNPDSKMKLEDSKERHAKEPKEGLQTSKDKVGETDTPVLNSEAKLQKARDDIEYFDNCLKESVWYAKNEFIEAYMWESAKEETAQRLVEEKEKAEKKNQETFETEDELRTCLQRLEQMLKREGMVSTDDTGTTYVGAFGEGVYWVEIKGPLAETWKTLRIVG